MLSADAIYKPNAAARILASMLFASILAYPTFAFSLQLEGTSNATTGNPVEDMNVQPTMPKQVVRSAEQPLKDKLALQQEIEDLVQRANRSRPAAGRNGQSTLLLQRQAANASWVLGLLSMNGLGVDQNYGLALLRFQQAQKLGEPLAAAGLAWCAIQGCDGLPSVKEARYWVAQLRPSRPGRAIYLDWQIDNTFSPLVANSASSTIEQDKAIVVRKQLLLNAAKTKDTQALIELGFDAVASERLKDAQSYFFAAAPNSVIAANNALLVQRRLTDKKTLCQITNSSDMTDLVLLNIAQALHRGESCSVNYIEAIRLYNMAANKGNTSAKRMLSLIYSKPLMNGNINIVWMQQLAQINITNMSTNIDNGNLTPTLQREPTPLFDLIPQNLRALLHTNAK
jgi:uncharacterized protein